jgi:hypothetical protein
MVRAYTVVKSKYFTRLVTSTIADCRESPEHSVRPHKKLPVLTMPDDEVLSKQGEPIEQGDHVYTKIRGGRHEGDVRNLAATCRIYNDRAY